MRARLLCLLLLSLAGSTGCITVGDRVMCSPAGSIAAGGICTHLLTSETHDLTFNEFVDYLEPQEARECIPKSIRWKKTTTKTAVGPVIGWEMTKWMNVCAENKIDLYWGKKQKLPMRGGALAMSPSDWGGMKTDLEAACRELGTSCKY